MPGPCGNPTAAASDVGRPSFTALTSANGYRSFLKKNHPTELERYDEACEALRREEFARFAELQTLGLYLHLQVQQKEAQFRRRRNRLLLGMTITGVMTSVLLYANFYPEQLQLISHELATLPGRISGFVGRLLH